MCVACLGKLGWTNLDLLHQFYYYSRNMALMHIVSSDGQLISLIFGNICFLHIFTYSSNFVRSEPVEKIERDILVLPTNASLFETSSDGTAPYTLILRGVWRCPPRHVTLPEVAPLNRLPRRR